MPSVSFRPASLKFPIGRLPLIVRQEPTPRLLPIPRSRVNVLSVSVQLANAESCESLITEQPAVRCALDALNRAKKRAAGPPHSQDYVAANYLFGRTKSGSSNEFPGNSRDDGLPPFLRPLLYQLSYLGGGLILLGVTREREPWSRRLCRTRNAMVCATSTIGPKPLP